MVESVPILKQLRKLAQEIRVRRKGLKVPTQAVGLGISMGDVRRVGREEAAADVVAWKGEVQRMG